MADRRELFLDLLMRDKTGPASKSSAGNLKTVGEAAEGAAKSTERLGKESDKAEDQVQRFGRSAKTAARHVDDLDGEIANVERELVGLTVAWKEAESAAEKADLSKAIRRTQKDLRELNKSKGILGALIPEPAKVTAAVTDVGQVAAKSFSKSFAEAVATASGPASIGVAIAGAILAGAALPIVGSTIAAGILGAAGVGGVIGGLKLAARDSRVKAAAKSLGDEVMDTLDESAGAFVPAALSGIEKIRGSFKEISGDLKSIFDNSVRYVDPLVRGATGAVEQAIGGISKAVAKAGPVIDVISRNLPVLGATIGDVFEKLSRHAPEAATALEQVFRVIEGGVTAVGAVLDKLATVYGLMAASGILGDEARDNWIKYQAAALKAADGSDALAGKEKILAGETLTAAEAADLHREALIALNNQMRAEVDPLFAFVTATDKVTEAQKKRNKAIKEHGPNSKEAAAADRELADAALDVNDAASKVSTTADGKLTPALRHTLEQAGLLPDEIRSIETRLIAARGEFNKFDGLTAVGKVVADTGPAMTKLGQVLAMLRAIKSKRVTVSVGLSLPATSAAVSIGRLLSGRAEGGPVEANTPYIVGEKRPEVFVPETNGTIVPSVGQYMGGGARTGGSSTTTAGRNGDGWVAIRGDAVVNTLIQAIAAQVGRTGRAAQLGIRFT